MMAEVRIDTALTIETDEEKDGHMRRFSAGNSDDQICVVKVEPHYLSVSSGSCHDLCKHGIKSIPKTKVKRSLQRNNSLDCTSKTAEAYEVIKNEIPKSSSRVTVSLRRQTSSPAELKFDSEKHVSQTSSSLGGLSSRRNSNISMSKEMGTSDKQSIDFKGKPKQAKSYTLLPARPLTRRHSEIIILENSEPICTSSVGGSSGHRNSEKKMKKEKENSKMETKKSMVRERFSSSPALSTTRILSAQSEYINKLRKVPSTLKNRKRIKEVKGEQPTGENVTDKTLYVIEPRDENQAVGLVKSGSFTASLFSEGKGVGYGECTVKASHSPPTENSFRSNTHSSLSSFKSQSSISPSPEAMQGEGSAFDIDNYETENPITDLEVENTRTPRIRVVSLEDRDWPPSLKLHFRSGNVVDVQFENRSPSLLKFRHKEVLAENQNGISDTRGRSLRRLASDGALYQTKSETVKVALKHQDTETRKETWGLFNNVIEETANKLVQSKKSRVKALVGAFEAVFCRQDSNPWK